MNEVPINKSFTDLIVIEGSDGSGKKTQSQKLYEYIDQNTSAYVQYLDFPDYESETGKLISAMLRGDFGEDAKNLNAYFTSPMYGLDRYREINQRWSKAGKHPYNVGICNRYTPSNLIHQGARLNMDQLVKYWAWLDDFEYTRLGIPRPAAVIYLNVPFEIANENVRKRAEANNITLDINEQLEYMKLVDDNVKRLRSLVDWKFIECVDESGKMRDRDEIFKEILNTLYNCNNLDYNHLYFTY